MLHYQSYLLNNIEIEKNILDQVFNKQKITPENFYRTGYEYIPFAKERSFALETILTSVLVLGSEIIIIDSGKESILPVELCLKNDIKFKTVKAKDHKPDLNHLEELLTDAGHVAHVCISLADEWIFSSRLTETLDLLNRYNTNIIIDHSGNVNNLVSLDINSFDFLASSTGYDNVSFIAARRNKLVQTEGNARLYSMDLHGFWQQTLRNRRREIEPMYF